MPTPFDSKIIKPCEKAGAVICSELDMNNGTWMFWIMKNDTPLIVEARISFDGCGLYLREFGGDGVNQLLTRASEVLKRCDELKYELEWTGLGPNQSQLHRFKPDLLIQEFQADRVDIYSKDPLVLDEAMLIQRIEGL